jgi:hypothetical protein
LYRFAASASLPRLLVTFCPGQVFFVVSATDYIVTMKVVEDKARSAGERAEWEEWEEWEE